MRQHTFTEYEMEDYDNFKTNLTTEDVVKGLSYIARGYIPDYNFTGSESDFEAYKNQMIMHKAIELIEKSINTEK